MAIRLRNVKANQAERLKKLGACKIANSRIWVIPESVTDIDPFVDWLPQKEGFIVQRPHFVAKAKIQCHKCGTETPIVALGAKKAYQLSFTADGRIRWLKWDSPFFFEGIDYLSKEIVASMQEYYPFFQRKYCKNLGGKIWGSTCIHCHVLQEENDEFLFEATPLSPVTMEDALEIRLIYFKLKFDYFIEAGFSINSLFYEIIS
jgi:hypothetical protein